MLCLKMQGGEQPKVSCFEKTAEKGHVGGPLGDEKAGESTFQT